MLENGSYILVLPRKSRSSASVLDLDQRDTESCLKKSFQLR